AIRGERRLEAPLFAEWWEGWAEMGDRNCFDVDVMSLVLYQGQNLFELRAAAMTNHVEPVIAQLPRDLGGAVVGIMRMQSSGNGALARSIGVPTQTLTIPIFSPHKEEAADFLRCLHSDEMMKLMYEMAGAVTPDSRFKQEWLDTSADRQILEWIEE